MVSLLDLPLLPQCCQWNTVEHPLSTCPSSQPTHQMRALERAFQRQGKDMTIERMLQHCTRIRALEKIIDNMITSLENAHYRAQTQYRKTLLQGLIHEASRIDRAIEAKMHDFVDQCRYFTVVTQRVLPEGVATIKMRNNFKSYFREKQKVLLLRFRDVQSQAKAKSHADQSRWPATPVTMTAEMVTIKLGTNWDVGTTPTRRVRRHTARLANSSKSTRFLARS
eukprot:TRINITY_DN3527_c0_g1_i1.p1 TRINITY_DN3527_c0_g1~~TRINITY_DN3527_c0_g1_i1.p1  ORF type:complete len:224 (-),score=6.75 TRINITY_DN3527_c0_g1_i1:39-710(-)